MEELRCCGNCRKVSYTEFGETLVCTVKPKKANEVAAFELCDNWEFDGMSQEDRKSADNQILITKEQR